MDISLRVGVRYAKYLARTYKKPLIPVNHMEAHALAARIEHTIDYPFLCLLASGGHCQLLMIRGADDFHLLGETANKAPGNVFDRVARELNLQALPEYRTFSGGKAIEMAAYKSTNPDRFSFHTPLRHYRDCDFSFGPLIGEAKRLIEDLRKNTSRRSDQIIPYYEDICAGLLKAVTQHLLQRTQRAMHYCERINLFGHGDTRHGKSLVFSGGVACNQFIFKALSELGTESGYKCFKPSNRLCSDNGVMTAWAGIERWLQNPDKYRTLNIESVLPNRYHGFNTDHVELLKKKELKQPWVKVPCMQRNVISLNDA